MKNRCLRAGICLLLVMVSVFGKMPEAKAQTAVETVEGRAICGSGEASVTIRAQAGKRLEGKEFEIHCLFEAENAQALESVDYSLNPQYQTVLQTVVGKQIQKNPASLTEYEIIDYIQSLNSYVVEGATIEQEQEGAYSRYRYFVEALMAELKMHCLEGERICVKNARSDHSVEITGLPYGYYLLMDVSDTEGKHSAVSMPILTTANPHSEMYLKADYPVLEAKIQEDSDGLWNDIADYEIGQEVPLRYQSGIPNINGYHRYYYAWHIELDDALSFIDGSLVIEVEGESDDKEKVYRLLPEEYRIEKDESDTGFVIEVEDIKKILDREFSAQNEKNERSYGQQVTVYYKAKLSDEAALDTGRPGFENDVRLEFSNNPNAGGEQETGYTVWDTVVCFTYQLQGRKINSYGKMLEGARFRLYEDEACKKEVYLQQVEDRYHVLHMGEGEEPDESIDIVSKESGSFGIYGLDADTYYLKEVEAPAGYRPLQNPICITLTAQFPENRNQYVKGEGATEDILQFSASAHMKTMQDGEEIKKELALEVVQEEGSAAFSVVNEVGKKLPVSGTLALLVVGVGGGTLLGCGILRGRKKR
ncbi:MAG: SpaA isopeptide-forming pilin-related protein [Faecalimonas sp.]|nr:SpaA isopeptide-forming pilin-related protein [Faecalimonas sp.]